jgi:tetratricopeptide (TPR) repeat protein
VILNNIGGQFRLNPEYAQALNNLANILDSRQQNSEALALLEKAVALQPDFAIAWMNLGINQFALEQYQVSVVDD